MSPNRPSRTAVAVATALVGSVLVVPLWIPWLPVALLGSSIIYAWSRPPRRELGWVVALACGALLVRLALHPVEALVIAEHPELIGFFLGHATLAVLALRGGPSMARYGAAWFAAFVVLRWFGIALFRLGEGATADGAMFLIDHALADPAYRVGQWLATRPAVTATLWLCYGAVPLTLPVAYGASLDDRPRCLRLLWGWALAGMLGVLCYRIVPVAGPLYALPGWPALPTGVTWRWLDVPVTLIRTGMPSLHLTWTILAWWFAPRSPAWVRPTLAVFVATTTVATLGLGQHFLIDLLVAVPFVVAVIALLERRWRLAGLSGTFTLAALVALRLTVQ
jgi:hypothetical protein